MLLYSDFLNFIIEKYSHENLTIHITDANARILASIDTKRIGTISKTAQQILVEKPPVKTKIMNLDEAFPFSFGTPFFYKNELQGFVIIHGHEEIASKNGELIQASMESALEYNVYSENRKNTENEKATIARMLLEENPDIDKLNSIMRSHDIEPNLTRTAICISLEFYNSTIPNTNWSVGYLSNIEQLRTDVFEKLNANRYLNSQDIVYLYDKNTIVVIKTFIPTADPARIYLALDNICRDFEKMFEKYTAFSFVISYGNLYTGIMELKRSLDEALEIITLGKKKKPDKHCLNLEYILFEKVYDHLCPQIFKKIIETTITKLTRKDGTVPEDLISCMEAFVDNCMSFSETSKNHRIHRNTIMARLEKLKTLTGLDPASSFQDAFLVKMLANYVKQQNLENSKKQRLNF